MMNGEMNGSGGEVGVPSMMGPGDPMQGQTDYGPPQGVHGAAPADLVEFLESVTRTGPIDTITIWQETLDGRQKMRTLGVKAIDPVELSANISRLIMGWTIARGRRTTFMLDAHAGAEHRGTHPIVREVQPTLTSQATEPPTEVGLLAMLMRHNDATLRSAHVVMDANAGHLSRQLREAYARIALLERERDQVAVMMRNNIIQSIDTEYLREQNRLKVHAQAQVVGVLIQALPSIIQRFTANEVVEKFRTFASALTPEQQFGIAAVLNKEQVEQLGALFKSLEAPKLPGQVEKALGAGDAPPPPAEAQAPAEADKPPATE